MQLGNWSAGEDGRQNDDEEEKSSIEDRQAELAAQCPSTHGLRVRALKPLSPEPDTP